MTIPFRTCLPPLCISHPSHQGLTLTSALQPQGQDRSETCSNLSARQAPQTLSPLNDQSVPSCIAIKMVLAPELAKVWPMEGRQPALWGKPDL